MIIDAHVHLFPDALCPHTVQKLANPKDGPLLDYYNDGSLDGVLELMNTWDICQSVLLPIATNPKQQRNVNSYALRVMQSYSQIVAFGSIHPDSLDWKIELQNIFDNGMKGVKFHPDYQGFFMDEEKMFPLYREIETIGLPIVFHTGYDPVSPNIMHATPERVIKVAKEFPNLIIVAAHTGALGYCNCPRDVYLDCPNVFFDTAIASITISPSDYRKLIDIYGKERFIFGTDNPWGNAPKDQDYFNAVGLTSSEKSAIFFDNAKRLYHIGE